MSKTALIGYGNTLRGDDGIGVSIVLQLSAICAFKQVLDCFTYEQLDIAISDTLLKYEQVIFIDCSITVPYGAVSCKAIRPDSTAKVSLTHHLSPEQLITLLDVLYAHKPIAYLIQVGGRFFDFGEDLSPAVKDCIPQVIAILRSLLQVY